MLNNNKSVPSPFNNKPLTDFFYEVDALRRKYKYHQIFIAYTKRINDDESSFHAESNSLSEGMLEYLRDRIVPLMEEDLEEDLEKD